jgi:hypothetical protein
LKIAGQKKGGDFGSILRSKDPRFVIGRRLKDVFSNYLRGEKKRMKRKNRKDKSCEYENK